MQGAKKSLKESPKSDYHYSIERTKEEKKIQIPLYILYTALFGKTESEEVEMRRALMKGLIPKETQDRLAQLLNKKSKQQFADVVSRTAWDTFYEQVWRIRCEKIIK